MPGPRASSGPLVGRGAYAGKELATNSVATLERSDVEFLPVRGSRWNQSARERCVGLNFRGGRVLEADLVGRTLGRGTLASPPPGLSLSLSAASHGSNSSFSDPSGNLKARLAPLSFWFTRRS